ncbi:uncharacterized protein isoform X2 [Choristoneura fumiferana]|uniref:uncharacterized protein isoform X2 n=1 Tax=Choristoneura fumiferana TaxID=7141 RepID=UPI003D1547D7
MSSKMSLHVTRVKKGPTLRINLTASCYGLGEANSATFVIDNLAHVSLKVKSFGLIGDRI